MELQKGNLMKIIEKRGLCVILKQHDGSRFFQIKSDTEHP